MHLNTMNLASPVAILVVVGFLGYYYYTLVSTRSFSGWKLWLIPLILGYFAVENLPADLTSDGHEIESVLLSAALGLVNGIFQGYFITLYRGQDQRLYQKGSWTAALVLLLTMPIRLGIRYLIVGVPSPSSAGEDFLFVYLVMFFCVLIGRGVTVVARHPWVVRAS